MLCRNKPASASKTNAIRLRCTPCKAIKKQSLNHIVFIYKVFLHDYTTYSQNGLLSIMTHSVFTAHVPLTEKYAAHRTAFLVSSDKSTENKARVSIRMVNSLAEATVWRYAMASRCNTDCFLNKWLALIGLFWNVFSKLFLITFKVRNLYGNSNWYQLLKLVW